MHEDGFDVEEFLADYWEKNPDNITADSSDYNGVTGEQEGGTLYIFANLAADKALAQAEVAKLRYLLVLNGISADMEIPELQIV